MPSSKDQCFQDATRAYEAATGKNLGIDFERQWVLDQNGTWGEAPQGSFFGDLWHSILKTFRIESGNQLPRAPGVPNPIAFRVPDMTITQPDGTKIVVDNKFTDSNGNVDPWRPQVNSRTGSTQRQDYNDINSQQTNGDPNAVDLSLDKNTCNCSGDPQPETVPVPAPAPFPFFAPLPAPGGVPVPEPGPFPEPFPIPELIPAF